MSRFYLIPLGLLFLVGTTLNSIRNSLRSLVRLHVH